jgi:Na+/proline symporter
MSIYAPALVLSVMLGLDVGTTSLIIGGIVVIYTTAGGVRAVNHTDVLLFAVIIGGMLLAFTLAVRMLPAGMGLTDALALAEASGRLKAIDLTFDPGNRYTLWSGLFGGMFVALAYFGTDQSQVQRYLTGRSVTESRLALLFNGLVKIPMQFFILLLGVMVFVFFLVHPSPLVFNPVALARIEEQLPPAEYRQLQQLHADAGAQQRKAATGFVAARRSGDPEAVSSARRVLDRARATADSVTSLAAEAVGKADPALRGSDVNYVFLSFVSRYLPAGVVGLLFACIFAASMSSSSGELSALATISVVDLYRRFLKPGGTERHYLLVSRTMMAFWGIYAIFFSRFAGRLGSLIEAVNILGSLFYGTMLGIFLLAFYVKSVRGTAAFAGAVAGEAVVLYCFAFTSIAWLWYNVIGCAVVILVAVAASIATETRRHGEKTA